MAKNIGQHGDIIAPLDKILGKQMAKCVGIDDIGVQIVAQCKNFELVTDSGGRNSGAKFI